MQMRFHPAKCKTMHLRKHNPNTKYRLPIDDGTLHEIAKTAEEKDLVVTIDDKLIFFRHIQSQQSISSHINIFISQLQTKRSSCSFIVTKKHKKKRTTTRR